MTDVLSRPRARAATTGREKVVGRPLTVSATLAGVGSALAGLTVFLAVAVTGWFLADGGAHGDTKDALRVGADAWLVGHGSHLSFGGVDYTLVPLGLTALLTWAAYRGGRWASRVSPPARDRELAQGAGLFCAGYVVVVIVTSVLSATAEIRGTLVLTLLGALLVGGVGGSAGLLSGRWSVVGDLLPGWAWPLLRSALASLLALLTCAAVLVAVPLALAVGSSASLVSRLGLSGGDAVMLVLLTALLAPNAVVLGAAYLLGPGFSLGVGTSITPASVVLGPVPSFPLLSALPDTGPAPWWTTALMALPALAALLGVVLAQRRHPVYAWDLGVLRGLAAGVLAGLSVGLLTGLGGGALGTGRMADVGAPVLACVGLGALSMGLGGLLGGLLATAFQRRGLLVAEADRTEEPTVEIVAQYRRDRPPPPASAREREATDLLHRLVRAADDDEDTIRLL